MSNYNQNGNTFDKGTGETVYVPTAKQYYTPKQKQDYHNQQAKRGATKVVLNPATMQKEKVTVSDFERGAHKATANMIFNKRKARAIKGNSDDAMAAAYEYANRKQ